MKYMLLIRGNIESRAQWRRLPASEQAAGLQAYAALNAELTASGELLASESLVDPSQSTIVTVRNGEAMATDGPFAEAKEFLAGFYLVDVVDRERAVEIVARIPEAEAGSVEIRPVFTYDGMG